MLLTDSYPTPFNTFATSAAPTNFGQHFYTPHAHAQSRLPAPHPSVFASAERQTRKRSYSRKEEEGEEEEEEEDANDDDDEKKHELGLRFKRPRKGDFKSASPLTNTLSHTTSSYDNQFEHVQISSSSFDPLATNHTPAARPRIVDLSSGEVLETLTSAGVSSSQDASGNDGRSPSDTDPTILTRTYNLAKRVRDRFDEFDCITDIWRRDDCAGVRFEDSLTYDQTHRAKRQRIEPSAEEMSIVKAVPSGSWTPSGVFRGTLGYTCELAKGMAAAFRPSFEGNGSAETCQDLVLYRAPSNQSEVEMGCARLIELGDEEEDKKEAANGEVRDDFEERRFDAMDLD